MQHFTCHSADDRSVSPEISALLCRKQYMPLDGDGPEHDVLQKQHLAGLLASGEPGAGGGSSTGV